MEDIFLSVQIIFQSLSLQMFIVFASLGTTVVVVFYKQHFYKQRQAEIGKKSS